MNRTILRVDVGDKHFECHYNPHVVMNSLGFSFKHDLEYKGHTETGASYPEAVEKMRRYIEEEIPALQQ